MPSLSKNKNLAKYFEFYEKLKANPLTRVSSSFLACVFLILILFSLAIQPSIVTIKNLQDQIDDYEKVNKQLSSKAKTLESLIIQFQGMKSQVDLGRYAVPDEADFPLFEKQIRHLVLKHKLNLNSINYSQFPLVGAEIEKNEKKKTVESKDHDYQEMNYSISVSGDYFKAKEFIKDLQDLIRIASVESVSLTIPKRSIKGEIDFTMNGKVYYLNEGSIE